MCKRLKNKVAMVTGAGSVGPGWGNGKATAVLFAREGAKIFAVDINPVAVEETKAIIEQEGGQCTIHKADVSKADEVKVMVERCIETYGRIDILHNNVGIGELGGPVEATEESWDRVNAVNIKSMFLTCKYVLPHMVKQGSGVISNVSSVAAIRGAGPIYVSYSATKAAVNQLTQSVAIQYGKNNIRANCILPGLMDTPMINEFHKKYFGREADKGKENRAIGCPMGKMGDGWDTAYAALFLDSEEAKYITGAQLIVDGGLSCVCGGP